MQGLVALDNEACRLRSASKGCLWRLKGRFLGMAAYAMLIFREERKQPRDCSLKLQEERPLMVQF